jgi:hypothetical protein
MIEVRIFAAEEHLKLVQKVLMGRRVALGGGKGIFGSSRRRHRERRRFERDRTSLRIEREDRSKFL